MSKITGVLLAMVLAAAAAPEARAAAPPTGVYSCYEATMNYRGQLSIEVRPFVMFGLINGSDYADYDGHHGHYAWNEAAGVLTMTDGSRQGWRYRKLDNWSFAMIDNSSGKDAYTCPFTPGKDPNKGPW